MGAPGRLITIATCEQRHVTISKEQQHQREEHSNHTCYNHMSPTMRYYTNHIIMLYRGTVFYYINRVLIKKENGEFYNTIYDRPFFYAWFLS